MFGNILERGHTGVHLGVGTIGALKEGVCGAGSLEDIGAPFRGPAFLAAVSRAIVWSFAVFITIH